ncbi:MAG: ATP synthase F1 subunit delta [Fidelibacterota bacterium]
MTHKQTAKRFAKALFVVSEQNSVLDSVYQSLNTLNDLVATESQFKVFVQSKRITGKQKAIILKEVMGDSSHPLVGELLSHLKGNQSISILKDVTHLFNRRYKVLKNIISVKGTVASEMSEDEKSSLKSSLDQLLRKDTDLKINVDESLIGGIRLRIENTFLDASVQNRLRNLKSELLQS